ncbi:MULTISPECIES: hypothetical protein [Gammaproteobacteria]|uniref:Uncharacterized protein n=1 Tax=Pseudomonas abyssi TaxID=170540 RepID=A0A395R5S2_9PSED|nr:hypothetical protein [Halopseudomonas gallaeciensis]RGP55142.1 hypothetical protein ASB58_08670 [Halopseudomonas gallaeciensis]
MNRVLNISLLVQLLLVAGFLGLAWQADQLMDKSGVGDLEAWNRFNNFAGIAFYGVALVWLATIILSLAGRAFGTPQAQLAVGMPPLALVLGWLLSWVI